MSALTPQSILDAAARDLALRVAKREGNRPRGLPYCFCLTHVLLADSIPQLLELALADRGRGVVSPKPSTRAIYADAGTLHAALALARQGAATQAAV